jgi:hypothetical protein
MPGPYAADCTYLRYTIESGSSDGPVVGRCTHPIRTDFRCVGPFLDEMATDCGLWEPATPAGRIRPAATT